MAAATLLEASTDCPTDLLARWKADTLKAAVIAFAQDLYDDFPDDLPDNHPIANWLAVIGAFAPTIQDFENATGASSTGQDSVTTYSAAVRYVYRLCRLAFYYEDQGGITPAQAAAILAAYNARLA